MQLCLDFKDVYKWGSWETLGWDVMVFQGRVELPRLYAFPSPASWGSAPTVYRMRGEGASAAVSAWETQTHEQVEE